MRGKTEVTAKVSNVPLGLDTLSVESQEQLRQILEREQRRALAEPSECRTSEDTLP